MSNEVAYDSKKAHRRFAIELNNIAWDLVEADQRTEAQIQRMLHAAHGACFHWLEVGNLLNHLRVQCLLATAYVKAGLPDAALCHARQCLSLSREAGDTQTAFDRATAHGCACVAYKIAGQIDEARSEYKLARLAVETFDDPHEGVVFNQHYPAP